MLQELQLSVCALGQNRSAERLHNLLDGYGLAGELILGGAAPLSVSACAFRGREGIPDETESAHAHGLQVGVPLGCVSGGRYRNEGYVRTGS
jgi:hypothetical protein